MMFVLNHSYRMMIMMEIVMMMMRMILMVMMILMITFVQILTTIAIVCVALSSSDPAVVTLIEEATIVRVVLEVHHNHFKITILSVP